MNVVITTVNFVKCNALNAQLFCELCEDAHSDYCKAFFTLTYSGFLVAMFLIDCGI